MSRIFLLPDDGEIARRRRLVSPDRLVEAWPDLYTPGLVWMADETRALLETAAGEPLKAVLSLETAHVPIYYGPRLTDLASLPAEASLQARILSGHGFAAVWITLDRFGERVIHRAESPLDPVFFLRRPGGGTTHQWRLFRTKPEAVAFVREHYGNDPEARDWAAGLAHEGYEALLASHGRLEADPTS
jgi:hypothetical protein